MKRILLVIILLVAAAVFVSCGAKAGEEIMNTEDKKDQKNNIEKENMEQTGYTAPVPSSYLKSSDRQGTVEHLRYDSKDYSGSGTAVTKDAYIYLPYGYDESDKSTRYDIIYLMHGWGGHAGEYFELSSIKNVFDNMIENGDMPPAIIVSATFYNDYTGTDFGSSVSAFRAFHQDFENDLMPAVEGKYHTYAKSVSDEDLRASRDHRIFGGFSLGSVTTWLEFCHDYDYIRYFLPMSGSSWYYGGYGDFQIERNVDYIEQLVMDNDLDERGYFIYHAVGTNDAVKSQSIDMADEMLSRSDIFTPDHYVFYQKDGGYHDFDAVREYLYNALPVFFEDIQYNESPADNEAESSDVEIKDYYSKETRITDVANDPAFGDYGRLIFPVNSGYMSGSTLGDLRLTWYNYIDPGKTVEICNYMKTHVENGDVIFYDIYTEAEKKADPAKKDTGLFFFNGDPGEKFAVCNAGGGFAYVGAMHDSFPHALELSKKGYNAFALIYRPGWQTACEDLSRAITFIFEHSDELEVDTDGYSLWGGSAGGRMADWVGTYGTEYFGEKVYPHPAAVIVNYTGLSEVTGYEPPTYSAVGTGDGIANWRTMKARLDAMSKQGIPTEFHAYKGLPHGFGLGTGTEAEGWINDAVVFWENNMI